MINLSNIAILLMTQPQNGGEHQYSELIAEGLLLENRKSYRLFAICCNDYWRKWCIQNHVNYVICYKRNYSLDEIKWHSHHFYLSQLYHIFFSKLGKIVVKNNIKILICGQQGIFLPKLPCKIICPVHDLMHRYESRFHEIAATYEVRELIFKWLAQLADVIIVESELGKKQFAESYLRHKRKLQIEVLPYVAVPYIRKTKEEFLTVPDKYIFYPAQFWSHKNHINLVKAIELIKKDIPDIQLILVGSEKNTKKKIESYILEHGLENNIHILGFVKNSQITYLYKHAVAMVMPSYFGPTNLPPLEAMALGCPAVVSDIYAMPEQLGDAGLFFDPDSPEDMAKKIKKIWTDAFLRKEMIKKGYQRIEQWTDKEFKKKFSRIILTVLNN